MKTAGEVPKYQQILSDLRRSIVIGQHATGDRLPSETDLGKRYGVSRLTVQRALKELQIEGLVERRAGSGTYVLPKKEPVGHLFGLLIPGLGKTEIFEPMCQGMAKACRVGGHALLWGDATHGGESQEFVAQHICEDYVARKVSGVLFAPIEGVPDKDAANQSILSMLNEARIPVVLLDRCIETYPNRSRYDLVGIDNRRGGFVVTEHLLKLGASRPLFLALPHSAPTVNQRFAGFVEALRARSIAVSPMLQFDPTDRASVKKVMSNGRPDAIVCANDATAANLMQTLESLGAAVPGEIRIAAFDDVRYASLLRVPLTTLRQPCQELGESAIQAMLSRIELPELPARDILLACELVVRQSCGTATKA